jgi:high-affinity iron transporter
LLYSFLITTREGFEIALVIALILAYLKRTGNEARYREVWAGVIAATLVCIAAGAVLELTAAELSGAAQEAFEGVAMFLAAAVLTWMVFWMRSQASSIGRELRDRVQLSLQTGSLAAIVLLSFTAVVREGFETVLFLFAGSSSNTGSTASYLAGGFLGFAIAGALGVALYRGSHVIPMRQFFTVTGVVVIFLAAGLVSNGLAEVHEAGIIQNLGSRPWDTDATISTTSTLGRFLHTFLGYDSAPAWGQIVAYWVYLAAGLGAFLSGVGVGQPRPSAINQTSI